MVAFAYVSAAPMPEPDGPMENLFDMFAGIPKGMAEMADQTMGRIPFMNILPQMMKGGLDMGGGIAKGMDNMMNGKGHKHDSEQGGGMNGMGGMVVPYGPMGPVGPMRPYGPMDPMIMPIPMRTPMGMDGMGRRPMQ